MTTDQSTRPTLSSDVPVGIPDTSADDALRGVVSAWEALPEGPRSVREVQAWLLDPMKPAIDACREALRRLS